MALRHELKIHTFFWGKIAFRGNAGNVGVYTRLPTNP
jgi:hypothetical protein